MSIQLQRAELGDASELANLVNSAYRGDSSRAGWTTEADLLDGGRTDAIALTETLKTTGQIMLKYVEDGEIIGCVYLHQEKDKLYLGMLSVKPTAQNKGIGKKLLAAAEEEARRLGCMAVFMQVISVRKELIDWYVRHGYHLTGERKKFDINDPRFGLPKTPLEFIFLEKQLMASR